MFGRVEVDGRSSAGTQLGAAERSGWAVRQRPSHLEAPVLGCELVNCPSFMSAASELLSAATPLLHDH